MSRPLCTVTVDGAAANVRSVTIDEAEGGGGTCTIVLASPVSVDPDSRIIASPGYITSRGNDTAVEFDSSLLDSSLYAIERVGDTLTATWGSRLNARLDLAPTEREVFTTNRGGLHAVMRHVICTKIGYSSFGGNIPNVAVPREIVFEPTESYWSALQRLLTGFKPVVLPDDVSGKLYLYWLDGPLHGTPRVLPFKKAESVAFPKQIRQIVNQCLIRYWPQGFDGRYRSCSGQLDSFVSDETGHVIATSGGNCGDDAVDLDTQGASGATIRSRTHRETNEDGTSSNITRYWYEWPDGRTVEFKLVTVLTGIDPTSGAVRKMSDTTVTTQHLPGTNYEKIAGTRTVVHGLASIPGVGERYVQNLKIETEQISYFQLARDPGNWREHTKRRETRGWALYPERVPLEVATRNEAVVSSSDTYQYVTGNTLLCRRNEYVCDVTPTQIVRRWEEVDCLKGTRAGDYTDESIGSQDGDSRAEPIEELVQDLSSISADGARTAVVIDATWLGSDVERPTGGGADATIGREWAVAMAEAMFRRAGKGVVTLSESLPKYVRSVRRGSFVRGERRGETHTATYLVTGRRIVYRVSEGGKPSLTMDISARRAAALGEAT